MKIRVKADGHNIWLALPNWMVLNGVTRSIAVWGFRYAEKYANISLNNEQLNALFGELQNTRRLLGRQPLVDVHTSDGEVVYIRL